MLTLIRTILKIAIGFIITKKRLSNFQNKKLCQQVLREKKELQNVDPSEFDFPEGTAIFIIKSFCSYYKMLWNKCKKLLGKKNIYIHVFYLIFRTNGKIRYSIRENGSVHTITHIADFKKNFPDIDINDYKLFLIIIVVWLLVFE